jgi:hypothetical protein
MTDPSNLPTIRSNLNGDTTNDSLLCSSTQLYSTPLYSTLSPTDYPLGSVRQTTNESLLCYTLSHDTSTDYRIYRLSALICMAILKTTICCTLLCLAILCTTDFLQCSTMSGVTTTDYPLCSVQRYYNHPIRSGLYGDTTHDYLRCSTLSSDTTSDYPLCSTKSSVTTTHYPLCSA